MNNLLTLLETKSILSTLNTAPVRITYHDNESLMMVFKYTNLQGYDNTVEHSCLDKGK